MWSIKTFKILRWLVCLLVFIIHFDLISVSSLSAIDSQEENHVRRNGDSITLRIFASTVDPWQSVLDVDQSVTNIVLRYI